MHHLRCESNLIIHTDEVEENKQTQTDMNKIQLLGKLKKTFFMRNF